MSRGLELGGESAKARIVGGGRADRGSARVAKMVSNLGPVPTREIIQISVPVIRPWPKLLADGTLAGEKEKWGEVFLRVRVLSTEAINELFDPRPLHITPIECFLPGGPFAG